MIEWDVVSGRLVPYWITVLCSLFIMAFLYAWTNDPGFNSFYYGMFVPVRLTRGLACLHYVDWRSHPLRRNCTDGERTGSRRCGLVLDSHWTRRANCSRKLRLLLAFDDASIASVALQVVQQARGGSSSPPADE
jgi:hypothetical protein